MYSIVIDHIRIYATCATLPEAVTRACDISVGGPSTLIEIRDEAGDTVAAFRGHGLHLGD